jgi:hypothetical protein
MMKIKLNLYLFFPFLTFFHSSGMRNKKVLTELTDNELSETQKKKWKKK